MLGGARVEGRTRPVEHSQHALSTPVGCLIQNSAVSQRGVARFQYVKVGGELNHAGIGQGCFVEIDNFTVWWSFWIDSKVGSALDPLISPGLSEGPSIEHRRSLLYFDPNQTGAQGDRRKQGC